LSKDFCRWGNLASTTLMAQPSWRNSDNLDMTSQRALRDSCSTRGVAADQPHGRKRAREANVMRREYPLHYLQHQRIVFGRPGDFSKQVHETRRDRLPY
jgi:hypothetical protein